ncbi:MAG: hypothetical protein IPN29_06720 [Saprospiraceae bacterium]|nr:hypothetical protein [Saprospiraceae bacterium]
MSKLWLLFVFYQVTDAIGASNSDLSKPLVKSTGVWILQEARMRFEPYDKGSCYPDKISGGGEFDLVITQNFVCDAAAKSPAEFKAGFKWSRPPARLLPGEAVPITLSADYLGGTPDFGICSIFTYFKDFSHKMGGSGVTGLINGQHHYEYDNSREKLVIAPLFSVENNKLQTLVVKIRGSSNWYWEYDYKWSDFENDHLPADITIDWGTRGDALKGSPGKQFNVYLPPGGSPSSRLWGTDIYTDDSSIGTAAVHAGLLTFSKGGHIVVEKMAGQAYYVGSTRFGVTSANWGAYGASFILTSSGSVIKPDPKAIAADWNTQANNFRGRNGERFTYTFPAGGTLSSRVWGTDVYTDDSSIGSCAVHAGLITAASGGTVTIEIRTGQSAYKGTTRNGVGSKDYGAYSGSFVFVGGNAGVIINPDPKVITADWNTQADNFRGRTGERFTYTFPAGGTISSRVWGTDVYTDDSSIGSCAVHAGLITAAGGGTVTIEIRAGQSSYKGTSRNGVVSKDYGAYSGSFVFVGGNAGVIINPDPKVITADWNTQADNFRGRTGERFTYTFPAGGTLSSRVWGTDVYTDDSSIGSCAVHAGLITAARGGIVTIEIRAGQSAYKGTTRNGVGSKDYGAYSGSFVFVGY